MDNEKKGLGIVTCNRVDFFKKCISKINKDIADHIVVVNDGDPYPQEVYPDYITLIQHDKNKCVGVSKNDALKYLMEQGCNHLFTLEDDIIINKPEILDKYIELSKLTGIEHLNFGYHGPANMTADGKPNPRVIVNGYKEGLSLALNTHCVGALSYYTRNIIEKVGYLDENFVNAWEHVENSYRIIKAGMHPPFWYFADLANSYEYLSEIASSEVNSTIRKRSDWGTNVKVGRKYFAAKHGVDVLEIPQTNSTQVMIMLKKLRNTNGNIIKN